MDRGSVLDTQDMDEPEAHGKPEVRADCRRVTGQLDVFLKNMLCCAVFEDCEHHPAHATGVVPWNSRDGAF